MLRVQCVFLHYTTLLICISCNNVVVRNVLPLLVMMTFTGSQAPPHLHFYFKWRSSISDRMVQKMWSTLSCCLTLSNSPAALLWEQFWLFCVNWNIYCICCRKGSLWGEQWEHGISPVRENGQKDSFSLTIICPFPTLA